MNKAVVNVIEVKGLVKRYEGKKVVKGISFEVREGEIFGILGPNGAGKTTTLEMIETLRKIDEGKAAICGLDVSKNAQEIKKLIGIQAQSSSFFKKLTLKEQLEVFADILGVEIDAEKELAKVGLEEKKKAQVGKLSGGQQQRFSILLATIGKPKVLFLDEPTTGLDPQARRNVWGLIEDIRKAGMTVVMTTHYMDEAEILCDRVAIMNEGRIIAVDTPEGLIKNLLKTGFKRQKQAMEATLEDVFINMTGKEIRE